MIGNTPANGSIVPSTSQDDDEGRMLMNFKEQLKQINKEEQEEQQKLLFSKEPDDDHSQAQSQIHNLEKDFDVPCTEAETKLMRALDTYAEEHIKSIVEKTIHSHEIDAEKWSHRLEEFVKRAVRQITPSSRMLNDSMNMNDFVKIKFIDWKDETKS